MLGLDDYTERLRFYIRKIKNDQPVYFPDVNAKMSIINSEDAAEFLVFLSRQKSTEGPVNCASSIPISVEQLIQHIEKIVGKKVVLSAHASESPYGISADGYMDVERVSSLGFRAQDWRTWLPSLILQSMDE